MNRLATWVVLALLLGPVVPLSAQSPDDLTAASPPTLGASVDPAVHKGAAPEPTATPAGDAEMLSIIVTFDDTIDVQDLEAVSGGEVVYRYREILNGASMILAREAIPAVAGLAGVTAIHHDRVVTLDTDSSPAFIGAPALWEALEGQRWAGEGFVVGVIDSGIWPEHPSFSDPDIKGNAYPPPPVTPGGNGFGGGVERSTCDFGNSDWNRGDVAFTCNNKLIGAYRFQDTYDALRGLDPDEFASARDSHGHGTHTASVAAGNAGVPASILGAPVGTISGVAPRAHLIVYRTAAGPGGRSFYSDVAAAIEQAILDGVDVLNYSMGGGQDPYNEVPSLAFLAAYEQGIFVTAPAGNDGPDSGTVAHREPWVMTVAASSQDRTLNTQPYLELGGSAWSLVANSSAPKQGDVMGSFSSRGGPELTLGISKPDLSAPGVEILAGHTPAPARRSPGLGGDLFQALAGTSASTAHVAGAGALLMQLHPSWTPGQIQSALMMSAWTEGLVKEDGLTEADPFDYGSGRVDLERAAQVNLTMAPQASEFVDHQEDLWNANYPSLYLPSMPGRVVVQRTIRNNWYDDRKWFLSVHEPEGTSITVPNQLRIQPNSEETFEIIVEAEGVPLGEVRHTAIEFKQDDFTTYMPITIVRQQPVVTLATACSPALMPARVQTNCTITMTNISAADATVSLRDPLPKELGLVHDTLAGATVEDNILHFDGTLAGNVPPLRLADEPALYGYVRLAEFGIEPAPCPEDCDDGGYLVEGLDFIYQDIHYDQAIWSVNGTLELGTSSGVAASGANTPLPDPALPNNLLAPWWTDLDLSAGGKWYAGALTDGAQVYDVFEWRNVARYGDDESRASFQIWLARGTNLGWFTYGGFKGDLADGTIGIEDAVGILGQTRHHGEGEASAAPQGDLHVDQNSGAPGETHIVTFSAEGAETGRWRNCVWITGDLWEGRGAACTHGQVVK